MVFNALISNSDDHPRNHALIAWKDSWRLSPAYDLTPTAPIALDRRDLALTIGDSGRYANAQNLLSQSRRFGLSHDDAATMLTQMAKHVTDRWQDACRRAGVTDRDCERIAGAFVYPGFWLSTP